jgi:hypothetical protein
VTGTAEEKVGLGHFSAAEGVGQGGSEVGVVGRFRLGLGGCRRGDLNYDGNGAGR